MCKQCLCAFVFNLLNIGGIFLFYINWSQNWRNFSWFDKILTKITGAGGSGNNNGNGNIGDNNGSFNGVDSSLPGSGNGNGNGNIGSNNGKN